MRQSDGRKEFIILRSPYGLSYSSAGVQKIMMEEHATGGTQSHKPQTPFQMLKNDISTTSERDLSL